MEKAIKKYALITGASTGVGRQYALQLAAKGYDIVLVSNDEDGNQAVSSIIKQQYLVDTIVLTLDLTLPESVDNIIKTVDDNSITVEVLICNAGILSFGSVVSTQPNTLQRIIDLHCKIPTLLCHEFGQRMSQAGKGYILLMSSATAWMPYPTIAAYSATKAYLKTFGRALYYELRPINVNVTVVFPGAINTSFYKLDEKMRHKLLRSGIMLTPQLVAQKALNALFRGQHRLIPGLFTKLCVGVCVLLPPFLLKSILSMEKVQRLWMGVGIRY